MEQTLGKKLLVGFVIILFFYFIISIYAIHLVSSDTKAAANVFALITSQTSASLVSNMVNSVKRMAERMDSIRRIFENGRQLQGLSHEVGGLV